jgi:predicted phosphate transport protein (TIGR00153 family)
MGLQDMIRWILPREDVFYSMLESHSVLVVEAAQALAKFGTGSSAEQVHERVRDLEHKADSIVYEIEDQLARVFVTPIDREDIQMLASALDDIIDLMNLTARTMMLYGVPGPTPPMTELMQLLIKMTEMIRNELPALRTHEYNRLIAVARELKQLEKEGDRIFRNAVSELFHDKSIDAKVLLRDKEVLEDLERAIDKCDMFAERAKHLAVKHG